MASARSPRPEAGMLTPREAPALRSLIESRYRCAMEELTIAGTRFDILRVADSNALLDALDPAAFLEDERLPYWSEIWASSVSLAGWCLLCPALRGKRVVELGCGVGLAGIAAARAGATVLMTDYEEDALLFARYNALENLPGTRPRSLLFDWRQPRLAEKFDIVLGADILYERRHFLPLLEAFDVLLEPEGRVVLTDPNRSTGEAFATLAQEWGYSLRREEEAIEFHAKRTSIVRFELHASPGAAAGKGRR